MVTNKSGKHTNMYATEVEDMVSRELTGNYIISYKKDTDGRPYEPTLQEKTTMDNMSDLAQEKLQEIVKDIFSAFDAEKEFKTTNSNFQEHITQFIKEQINKESLLDLYAKKGTMIVSHETEYLKALDNIQRNLEKELTKETKAKKTFVSIEHKISTSPAFDIAIKAFKEVNAEKNKGKISDTKIQAIDISFSKLLKECDISYLNEKQAREFGASLAKNFAKSPVQNQDSLKTYLKLHVNGYAKYNNTEIQQQPIIRSQSKGRG